DGRTPFAAPRAFDRGTPAPGPGCGLGRGTAEPGPRGDHESHYALRDMRPNTRALCRRLWSTVAAPGGGGRVKYRHPSSRGVAGTVPLPEAPHSKLRERS